MIKLWKDEDGAVIAAEYLLLGSVVTVGAVSGLSAMRDSVESEFKSFAGEVQEARRPYRVWEPKKPEPAPIPFTTITP